MNYEEKFNALQCLCEHSLRMRSPGDWYVSSGKGIVKGDLLHGSYGNGKTPQEAIENDWEIFTSLPPDQYIVINAHRDNRKHYRWNKFMWQEIPQQEEK